MASTCHCEQSNGVIYSGIQQFGNSTWALLDDDDDDDDDNHHHHHNTQSTYSFFFSYPFLILRSFDPHSSIITNLHSLLSLFYSFLLVAGWWLSYSCRCFLPLWENKNFHTISEISYFHAWDIWHPQLSSVGHQDRALNTHESWMKGIPIHKAHIIHVLS